MKKCRQLLLAILLSVGTTWIVCWVLAIHIRPGPAQYETGSGWPAGVGPDWPKNPGGVRVERGFGWYGASSWASDINSSSDDFHLVVGRVGWPSPAMEWRLLKARAPNWNDQDGLYDNDGTCEAGMLFPLSWSRPWGQEWNSRRLPLVIRPVGFLVNAAVAFVPAWCMVAVVGYVRRYARSGWRWRWILVSLFLGIATNMLVAAGFWFAGHVRGTQVTDRLEFGEPNATMLPPHLAKWPTGVPSDWPEGPAWIGWHGERCGVRAIEYTHGAIPAAALMWFHVTWGPGAFDTGHRVYLVQYGWPLPALEGVDRVSARGRDGVVLGQYPAASWMDLRPVVPSRVLVLGFVANSLLYATVIGWAWLGWRYAVIRRRLRRGCCCRCGYLVEQLKVCPECGFARGESPCAAGAQIRTASPQPPTAPAHTSR